MTLTYAPMQVSHYMFAAYTVSCTHTKVKCSKITASYCNFGTIKKLFFGFCGNSISVTNYSQKILLENMSVEALTLD